MDKMNARKKAARAARLRKQRTRRALLTLCLMLAVAVVSVGGTIAWLTDKSGTITNTFTESDVDIKLDETVPTNKKAKMVPGTTIDKDPTVKVMADSEACWVFVKIEKSTDKAFDNYMTFSVAEGWTELTTGSGIYYRAVDDTDADQSFAVLKDNKVSVMSNVTKAMMDELTAANYPTLTFTAYAIQKDGFTTAAAAWTEASK